MRRFALAICLAVVCVMFPVSAAAKEPVISHYTVPPDTITVSGVCAFDLRITSSLDITEIDYLDKSGGFVRVYVHGTEQDTYTGPGGSLTSFPYTFNVEAEFDATGETTRWVADGVVVRVQLPDGSLFVSAGKINILNHRGTQFFFTPDFGRSGNLAALCAALA